jgi:signal peptidase I
MTDSAEPKKKTKAREWVETLLWAILLALVIRAVLIQAYKIPTGSMQPTLRGAEDYKVGDHLLVNKFVYGSRIDIPFTGVSLPFRFPKIRTPMRGDVVVFKFPHDPKKDYVKRCIGLPGETIEIRNKVVYINGEPLDEPWLKRCPKREYFRDGDQIQDSAFSKRDNYGPVVIPKNSYFMMGDNRDNSSDSRYWGVLDYDFIRGQAILVYWPPKRLRIVH